MGTHASASVHFALQTECVSETIAYPSGLWDTLRPRKRARHLVRLCVLVHRSHLPNLPQNIYINMLRIVTKRIHAWLMVFLVQTYGTTWKYRHTTSVSIIRKYRFACIRTILHHKLSAVKHTVGDLYAASSSERAAAAAAWHSISTTPNPANHSPLSLKSLETHAWMHVPPAKDVVGVLGARPGWTTTTTTVTALWVLLRELFAWEAVGARWCPSAYVPRAFLAHILAACQASGISVYNSYYDCLRARACHMITHRAWVFMSHTNACAHVHLHVDRIHYAWSCSRKAIR